MAESPDWNALISQAPPREVAQELRALALSGRKQFKFGLIAGATLCAVMFGVFFPWPIVEEVRLTLAGVPGRGVVIESFHGNRTVGDNILMRKRHIFVVRFSFTDDRGRQLESYCLHEGYLAPGADVEIEFLASRPQLARIRGGTFVPGGFLEVAFGTSFLALPLFALWNYRRWRNNRLQLLSHGAYAAGSIERVWCDDPRMDQRGWINVRFQTPTGAIGQTYMVEQAIFQRARALAEESAVVRILYEENSPRNHVILELLN